SPNSARAYSTSSRPPSNPAEDETNTPSSSAAHLSDSSHQSTPNQLPHLTASGSAHMVSISSKASTTRTAIATGHVTFSNPQPLSLIRSNSLKKGDVLSVARIAGIMAAKKCPDIVPLCHPINLSHVGVELCLLDPQSDIELMKETLRGNRRFGGIGIEAKVECTGQTGVEMEALTAVMGTALTVVDMCKAVDKGMCVGDVRVVLKEGGRSGVWRE
ncbi:MoaC-domain-containing protein, partial [Zopfia rhizophila CBS 207.26]